MVKQARPSDAPNGMAADLWLLARHDFRQPPQALELLAAGLASARTDAERQAFAQRLAQLAASMRQMIDGLTLVARLDAGTAVPAATSVAIEPALRRAIEALDSRAESFEFSSVPGSVSAHPPLLDDCLVGMIAYALKFDEKGRVRLTTERRGKELAVTAQFAGFHPRAARDGMAFVEVTSESPGARPRIALAPALVARIAKHMGGRLELTEAAEGTASITLVLPAGD